MTTTVPSRYDWEKALARFDAHEQAMVQMQDRIAGLEQQVRVLTGGTATEEV